MKPHDTTTMTSQPTEFIDEVVQEEDLRDCAEISFNINQTCAPDTSPGDNEQDAIAVPPKRRKPKRLIPGIPNYSRTAKLKQVLKAAEAMPDEEAREYMLRHFRYHGWGEVAIHAITTDPYLFLSIARYQNLASKLRAFDFRTCEIIRKSRARVEKAGWQGAREGASPQRAVTERATPPDGLFCSRP
ncbi:MAG: hypothetical protein NTV93_20885, partial [Verrucomicrobia bacterium]|nr:hypothetical protein [Verrucomicrobiota bacterium]